MPKTITQHESWCAEHNDDDNTCVSLTAGYGPDAGGVPWGGFWIQQDEQQGEPTVAFDPSRHLYPGNFSLEQVRALLESLDIDPVGFKAALKMISDLVPEVTADTQCVNAGNHRPDQPCIACHAYGVLPQLWLGGRCSIWNR